MLKYLGIVLLWPIAVAAEQCVLQDRTTTQTRAVIQERSPIRRDIVRLNNGDRKCLVDFRIRVGANWHTAIGEHTWSGDVPATDACARAVARAESDTLARISQRVQSEKILVCKDRPELQELRQAHPGTVGDIAQFRPHPDYPRRFWHNGAQCRWFMESAFTGADMQLFQGIICEANPGKWVVVDKF